MRQSVLAVAASVLVLAAFAFAQPKPVRPKILQSTAPELRLKGFEEYKAMQAASKFKDLKWQFIGPTNISGRVTDVAVVAPKGKNYTIYAASASGGVWKTENEGTTWTPIFENMATAAIGDIALAPSDQNIVWVGTGEHNIFRSSQAGVGIFKSVDGGKTWANMGLADTNTIARIVVHPTNPDVVYVA
ncbi:MAG: WD40/YVTN/BNR-like repeat-containing protein, partial [Candidatus Aminicenantales bacterium]